jgi:hypothetical protein
LLNNNFSLDKRVYENTDIDEMLKTTDIYQLEEFDRSRTLNNDQNSRSMSHIDKVILNQV